MRGYELYLIIGRLLMPDFKYYKNLISPHREPDKQFFLDLCDGEKSLAYESERLSAVMTVLKAVHISRLLKRIREARAEKDALMSSPDYDAEKYRRVLKLNAEISACRKKIGEYKPFFTEPYFARMDLCDNVEGYNSYYIGKRGDESLEIVDWRAPVARRYYQKSRLSFTINEYEYKVALRRAIRAHNGKIEDVRNEYLALKDYLPEKEAVGLAGEAIFDPFLKEILRGRKEKEEISDIIETIQEKQYEIITLPDGDEFVLQGVAGSGKTMIMLHRLSYIMYNSDAVKPSDVLVITPSDSFNAFIDELSEVLELEKVRTSTLENYFLSLVKSAGVDAKTRLDYSVKPPEEYLSYIYSEEFTRDVRAKIATVHDSVYGLFASDECRGFCARAEQSCERAVSLYDEIKNASLRVRRCVLGEIKEKEGGLYYTKPFREMFNCVYDAREFMSLTLGDDRMKEYAYFFRQLISFYKSVRFLRRSSAAVCSHALDDLSKLYTDVEKEMNDLKRYKQIIGGQEILTYAERIAKRGELLGEISAAKEKVKNISAELSVVCEFSQALRGEPYFAAMGKCAGAAQIASFFYRETVKKAKERHCVPTEKLCRSDPYAISLILAETGFELSPKFAYIFVDEAQDISLPEYGVLRRVNPRAAFNVFGDLKQNVTPWRGVKRWEALGLKQFDLSLNYRNTNQIVGFVAQKLGINMQPVGFDGEEVEFIAESDIRRYLSDKRGLRAVITAENKIDYYFKKSYSRLSEAGKVSKSKINIMTVYESKGLEFTAVAVCEEGMSDNEKYIAYTRALKQLAIVK